MESVAAFFTAFAFSVGSFLGWYHPRSLAELPVIPTLSEEVKISSQTEMVGQDVQTSEVTDSKKTAMVQVARASGYTQEELATMSDNSFADGQVPLGDSRYVTDAPKKGYVYLCSVHKENPGSAANGPWIHATTWNYLQKVSVDGDVRWPSAEFSTYTSGLYRIMHGNGLPTTHTTGVFPVASNDDAHRFDPNPNTIRAQVLSQKLPKNPAYSEEPYCIGGEVGVMLSGVALFNAFDAGLRDAPAHELQDSCDGHPQASGEYHYHSLSSCFKDISVETVLGYALDGFPITGPVVSEGKYLTTNDLDVCHGLSSEVVIDGEKTVTYHYVMTRDFPYSVSCFRAKPVSMVVIQGAGPQGQSTQQGSAMTPPQGAMPNGALGPGGTPPQEAINACSGKTQGASCSFVTPMSTVSGHCDTLHGQSLACVPR